MTSDNDLVPIEVHATTTGQLTVVPADLPVVPVNGGLGIANLVNRDEDTAPVPGQHVFTADGGSERLEMAHAQVPPLEAAARDSP